MTSKTRRAALRVSHRGECRVREPGPDGKPTKDPSSLKSLTGCTCEPSFCRCNALESDVLLFARGTTTANERVDGRWTPPHIVRVHSRTRVAPRDAERQGLFASGVAAGHCVCRVDITKTSV